MKLIKKPIRVLHHAFEINNALKIKKPLSRSNCSGVPHYVAHGSLQIQGSVGGLRETRNATSRHSSRSYKFEDVEDLYQMSLMQEERLHVAGIVKDEKLYPGMDTPWDETRDNVAAWQETRDAEWMKMSSEFTDAGYREGITIGKEASVQEGFDAGFATIGAPLGRDLGLIRGQSFALLSFLTSESSITLGLSESAKEALVYEARNIVSLLGNVRFSDIEPRDLEAEKHAREHLEAEGQELEVHEDIENRRQMENVEDMLAGLSTRGNANPPGRPTMKDVANLKARLHALTSQLKLSNLY